MGQFLWAIGVTIMPILCILLDPGETWKIMFLQMILTVVPIMVAIVFSPLWTTLPRSKPSDIREHHNNLHRKMSETVAQAEQGGNPRRHRAQDLEHPPKPLRKATTFFTESEFDDAGGTRVPNKSRHVGRMGLPNTHKVSLKKWGYGLTAGWAVHVVVWGVMWWAVRFYVQDNEYFQSNCDSLIAEGQPYLTVDVAAYILYGCSWVLLFLMWLVTKKNKGVTDMLLDSPCLRRYRPSGKYEKTEYDVTWGLKISNNAEKAVHWTASMLAFVVWLILNSIIYAEAMQNFLLVRVLLSLFPVALSHPWLNTAFAHMDSSEPTHGHTVK
ncbi:hypothetical protein MNV49_002668 [Pseudohyphozyma bogoriensis]|nr:hypothetical protein MNV49_002668 [Pseudohyphozyma bogoriensis]